jgi:hypothetical protein
MGYLEQEKLMPPQFQKAQTPDPAMVNIFLPEAQ